MNLWLQFPCAGNGRIQQFRCSQCQNPMGKIRENERTVLDLPLGTLDVQLCFTVYPGTVFPLWATLKQSRLPGWLPKRRLLKRLKQHVSHLCRYMPCNKIPEFISISHHTARRWDKEILMKTLPAPDLDNIRALLIDEKSIGKGHHYLTVVLNADTGETLFLGEGKRKATLDQFLSRLTPEQKSRIECGGYRPWW